MKEHRVFGPPGTGKTTRLATRDVPRAVAKYGRDKVMIVSFTRTAAFEIATKPAIESNEWVTKGKSIDVNEKNVGTLHKICYHALEAPTIVETDKELIKQFNEEHPAFAVTGRSVRSIDHVHGEGESFEKASQGDELLNILNIKRNKMTPQHRWHMKIKAFEKRWTDFKKQTNSMDFTDMIEVAIDTLPYAPGQPQVLFVDEAQDFTQLQLKLCRSWAQQMEFLVLVGDDDQCLYRFAGATPEAFLIPPVADNMKTILKQSYRVPQAVLDRSMKLINKVKIREPKTFKPRLDWFPLGDTAKGYVFERDDITWQQPDQMIPDIKQKLERYSSPDQKNYIVMILASCSYMLKPIEELLRKNGLPFSNKYRRSRYDWNPLYGGGNGVSTVELLKSFFNNGIDDKYWNVPQFIKWAESIKVGDDGIIKKHGKKYIDALKLAVEEKRPDLHSIRNMLPKIMTETAINRALARDTQWLKDNVKKSRRDVIEYPLFVYNKYGVEGIENEPPIALGTIHSVKGGQAECVYLFPDFSAKADVEFQNSVEARDAMYRVFYVAMTRARNELILCKKSVRIDKTCNEEIMYVKL